MLNNKQSEIAKENELLPFDVLVLEPTRTICEKIMSLIRFSYSEDPMEALKNKIRHIYDLHQLLLQEEYSEFFNSPAFEEMLIKVANDDVVSFKNNNLWLENHPIDAIIFSDLDNIWKELIPIYNGAFKNLVYGPLPEDADILIMLKRIKERLTSVNWTIKIPTISEEDI